jgi:hypothetical protein
MCKEMVSLTTRAKTYDTPLENHANGGAIDNPSTSTPPPSSTPLQIERHVVDSVLHPPKGTIRKLIFNPSACAAQNYNIVEDLVQAPCAMSMLEVLQNYPSQRRTLLSTIGVVDPEASNMIMFNLDYFKLRLSHHLTFQIQAMVCGKNIHHTVLDEGASTCVMSLSCWRAIGSPKLHQSPTTLKAFDGCGFQPYGLLQYFIVELKGKIVSIDIEVVDAPLDYNLLLGHSWFYAMIVHHFFSLLSFFNFPIKGKL